MTSKEVLEYLRTCKFCKIVMGTDYENDDRYFTLYDVFNEEIEIIQKDLDRLEKLEKAIEILKGRIEFEDLGEMQSGYVYRPYFNDCLDNEEYDLLKEVLENE